MSYKVKQEEEGSGELQDQHGGKTEVAFRIQEIVTIRTQPAIGKEAKEKEGTSVLKGEVTVLDPEMPLDLNTYLKLTTHDPTPWGSTFTVIPERWDRPDFFTAAFNIAEG